MALGGHRNGYARATWIRKGGVDIQRLSALSGREPEWLFDFLSWLVVALEEVLE